MSKAHNLIKLQLLISNIPAIQVFALIPMLEDKFNFSLTFLGLFFFIIRLMILVGSNFAKLFLNRCSIKSILSNGEFAAAIVISIGLISFLYNWTYILLFSLATRGFITGLTNNCRDVWLKSSKSIGASEEVIVFRSGILQFSFIIAGITYILFPQNSTIYGYVLSFDIITSIIGMVMYRLDDSFNIRLQQINKHRIFSVSPKLFPLIFCSFIFSIAMGGTDILCVNLGEQFFGKESGYGIASIYYSISFFIGYKITKNFLNHVVPRIIILNFLMIVTFLMMNLPSMKENGLIHLYFPLFFIFYGGILIYHNIAWFRLVSKENSSSHFFVRDLTVGLTYAFGEIFYAFFAKHEILIRVSFLSTLLLLLIAIFTIYKNQLLREVG